MDQEMFDFLQMHLQRKHSAFVTVQEVYDRLPMTKCVLRHSIEDVQDAIKQCKIWADLGTKCELKRVDSKYGPMTCSCSSTPAAELFLNVEFDLVKDRHFIECHCCSTLLETQCCSP